MDSADIVIALGGDGHVLSIIRKIGGSLPIFGINFGHVGFLLNSNNEENLIERISKSIEIKLHALKAVCLSTNGKTHIVKAYNEISLFRSSSRMAKIKIKVDNNVCLNEMIGDGIMLSTPAGSTAYNLAAGGAILPLDSHLMALTPIAAFLPRRWRGALLSFESKVDLEIGDVSTRIEVDGKEVADQIKKVSISYDSKNYSRLLFDSDMFRVRRLKEQFL